MKFPLPSAVSVAFLLGASLSSAFAASYTWTPTAAVTQSWNLPANWLGGGFPNANGDVANVTSDIVGNQSINLQQNISVGVLNIGDANASQAFTLGPGTPSSNILTFQSAAAGGGTQLNISGQTTISAGISLGGTSSLAISTAGSHLLGLSGAISTNGNNMSFAGGAAGASQFVISGDILGGGTITNNSVGGVSFSGTKSFTGILVANGKTGSTTAPTFSITTGSVWNASQFVINGFLSGGVVQNGGSIGSGNNAAQAANPGQRLTQNRITLNGGSLAANGQNLTSLPSEIIVDTVANLDFNSGYSLLTIATNATTAGTRLSVTALGRFAGASGFVRGSSLGGTSRVTVANVGSFLLGAGGAEGTTTMSVIPWLGAETANSSSQNPTRFATSGSAGVRALADSEYANSVTAGSTANVAVGSLLIASPTTVNSLTTTSSSGLNIGSGQVLTVASGGVMMRNNGAAIGVAGAAAAGTLNFGVAEGVIWSISTNSNGVGAVIAGSGGLTKAGTGTVVLAGTNTYTGLTYVGSGTLQVGDGTNLSNLGVSGDVGVANGAMLFLRNGNAIADDATLTLQSFGLYNGMVNLFGGVNETIGSLYLGDTLYGAGTYGAEGSGAGFESNQWFAGSGIITVVPEPTAVALTGLGLALLFSLSRRPSRAV